MEGQTMTTSTTSKSSHTTSTEKDAEGIPNPTFFIVVHNVHHMRLEFPPPPNHIIPTTMWDKVVTKLRMLGLKFIYRSKENIDDGRFYEFEREKKGNYPVVVHHEYNMHTDEFKHAKDGTQAKYAQETDPILGKVIAFSGDRNFVQEEITSFIQQKAYDVFDQYRQNHMVASNPETFAPERTALELDENTHTIMAIFLLWWTFISIAYLSCYHQRTSTITQTNSPRNRQNSSHNASPVKRRLRNRFSRAEARSENTL